MKNSPHFLFGCLLVCLLCLALHGCKQKKEHFQPKTNEQEVKQIEKKHPLHIYRYDQALAAIPADSLADGLKKLRKDYDFFVGENPSIADLQAYLNDPVIRDLYKEVGRQYADISDLEKGFQAAFARIRYHYPDIRLPRIYTIVSGMDFEAPVILVDSVLIISLDMYLGSDFRYYKQMGEYLPQYVRRHLNREHILSDCMKALSYQVIHSNSAAINLLDEMLLEGKRWMFTEIALPDTPDSVICLYTPGQLEWAYYNEYDVWSFLIQKNYLYGNDNLVARKLIGESPYTAYFGNKSPGNLGSWLGWQICRSWIRQNPNLPIKQLFEEKNPQKVLKESQYKPVKK